MQYIKYKPYNNSTGVDDIIISHTISINKELFCRSPTGATAFIRTPDAAHSTASVLVRLSTADRAAPVWLEQTKSEYEAVLKNVSEICIFERMILQLVMFYSEKVTVFTQASICGNSHSAGSTLVLNCATFAGSVMAQDDVNYWM